MLQHFLCLGTGADCAALLCLGTGADGAAFFYA
jgi:hypothetical protein